MLGKCWRNLSVPVLVWSLAGCSSVDVSGDPAIMLVAAGPVEPTIMKELQAGLQKAYGIAVAIGPSQPDPVYALDRSRGQFSSSRILDHIERDLRKSAAGKILVVTERDLFVPEMNFVFGQAGSRVAVISLVRFRQKFYGLPDAPEIFYKRMLTEAVHELGHTYGLDHCPDPGCVMFFSNQVSDTDRKGAQFCAICRRKLDATMAKMKPAGVK